jgi:hypothetical protein
VPLKNSPTKEARQFNILAEIHSGKPQKQAVAIGYAKQREAQGKKRKPKKG